MRPSVAEEPDRPPPMRRLERLDELTERLQTGDAQTIPALATALGVSRRTVARDLDILRARGVPIETERGQGGGVRVHRYWGVGRVSLGFAEAIDLLVTLAIAEQIDSPLFLGELASLRRKVIASFTPELRHRVQRLKARVLVAPAASSAVLSSHGCADRGVASRLHQAFVLRQEARIGYRAGNGSITQRVVRPHYLLLSSPVWYVLAWDSLRDDVRTFRCDRIDSLRVLESPFDLLPVSAFDASLDGVRIR